MSTAHPSPLGGRRPTRGELPQFYGYPVDDRLPEPGAAPLNLLIVGVNPGLWTAAVNAPFAYPGNRFWPSLDRAGIISPAIDCSTGMSDADEQRLRDLGIGITNLVPRATARADELDKADLIDGAKRVVKLTNQLQPKRVAVAGITAFRTGFENRQAKLGKQDTAQIAHWPEHIPLWVVPQPSGLNTHENIDSLAQKWRAVMDT